MWRWCARSQMRHQAPIRARDLRARAALPLGRRARGGFPAAGRRLQLHGSAASACASGQSKEVSRMQPLEPRRAPRALSRSFTHKRRLVALDRLALYYRTDSSQRKLSHFEHKRRLTRHCSSRTSVITCRYAHTTIPSSPIFHTSPSLTHSHHRQSPIPFSETV